MPQSMLHHLERQYQAAAAPGPIAGTPTHGYVPTREAGMSLISLNVRNRGQAGNVMLATSFSQFDPDRPCRERSFDHLLDTQQQGRGLS